MGVVYRAHDPRVMRTVALKTIHLPPGLSPVQKQTFTQRFLREAQAAGCLSHPGIVTVYDVEECSEHEQPFIAMEYVPGPSLQEVLRTEAPLPPQRAFAIVDALAYALQSAHAAQVIHRDIKPANIMVREPDGTVKITDFGVARLPLSELTHADSTLGSPAYMAPEQFRGATADGCSDFYSLAVVLYEALCGERPFGREDALTTAYSILHEKHPPVTERVVGLPPSIDRFFDRALAKDPSARFADGAAFRRALDQVRQDMLDMSAEISARPLSPRSQPRSRRLTYAVVCLLALAFALAGIMLYRQRAAGGRQLAPEVVAASDNAAKRGAPSASRAKTVTGRSQIELEGASATRSPALAGPAGPPLMARPAVLEVDAQSNIKQGTLRLLVDGTAVFQRQLSSTQGKVRRAYKKTVGRTHDNFSDRINIPPGTHQILAVLELPGKGRVHEERLVANLEPGETRTLRLAAGRTFGDPLSMKLD